MDRAILLSRIKNLLTKTEANGCTEAEAASALAAAQRIMDEHRIAMIEVFAKDETTLHFVEDVVMELGSRYPTRLKMITPLISQIFGVEIWVSIQRFRHTNRKAGHIVRIFGEVSTIEPAAWALRFLDSTFEHFWQTYRVKTRAKSAEATNYYAGLADGFMTKVNAERDLIARERGDQEITGGRITGKATTAIVVANSMVANAFAEAHPDVKSKLTRYRSDTSAYLHGIKDGREINLARPIDQNKKREELT